MQLHRSSFIHTEALYSLAVSPDGRLVAGGSADGWIRIWELPNLRLVAERMTSEAPYRQIYGLAFTPDSEQLVSAMAHAAQLLLWDLSLSRLPGIILSGPEDPDDEQAHRYWDYFVPYTPRFDPTGTRLVCGGERARLRCWDFPSLTMVWDQPEAHPNGILEIAFAPAGDAMATAGYWGSIGRWEMRTGHGHVQSTHPHHIKDCRGVAWSSDGTQLVSVGFAQDHRGPGPWPVLQRWNPATMRLEASVAAPSPWGESVAFHPREPVLVMGASNGQIILWDTTNWQIIAQTTTGKFKTPHLAWTSDGQFLVSGQNNLKSIRDQISVWHVME